MGGSCYDEEDFVKSFLPSLFDSDSEADETFLSVKSDTFRSFPDKPLHVSPIALQKQCVSVFLLSFREVNVVDMQIFYWPPKGILPKFYVEY